ncbi:MAG: DUF1844 domain-containing protein [Deltaproteobacteria bacterium]
MDFKVVDKRRFAETGGDKTGEDEKVKAEDRQYGPTSPLPPVDFPTFILSLSTSVLLQLGEVPDHQTNKTDRNLELARHTIDIINMLKDKTKDNLTDEEARLIDNILYDLRVRYVNISEQ